MEEKELLTLAPTRKGGTIDVVLDTDAYNEVDDQFAIAYLLRSSDKLNCKALYAAAFFNFRSASPKDGMEKSYGEILHMLRLTGREDLASVTFRGSETYLKDEHTPVISAAAEDLVARSKAYSREKPLYVAAIAAITNVASAILLDPTIVERIVVVWLGGHSRDWCDTNEFNLGQDVAAARVVMGSDVPFVQLPCCGVVSSFRISGPELDAYLRGKNALCDYLVENTFAYRKALDGDLPWSDPIWDVTAIGWLLNEDCRFLAERRIPMLLPGYDGQYEWGKEGRPFTYIWDVKRNELFRDLIEKLTAEPKN